MGGEVEPEPTDIIGMVKDPKGTAKAAYYSTRLDIPVEGAANLAKRLAKKKNIPGIAAGVAGAAALKGMHDNRTKSDTKGESRSARNRPASQNQQSVVHVHLKQLKITTNLHASTLTIQTDISRRTLSIMNQPRLTM